MSTIFSNQSGERATDLSSSHANIEVPPASCDRFSAWFVLCGLVLVIVVASCFVWIDHNPRANDWDNAEYINMVTQDYYAYQRGGVRGTVQSLLTADPARPPAYRIVVLPVTLSAGVSVLVLRLTSILLMGVMAVLIYFAVSRPAGRPAGMLAASLVCCLVSINMAMRVFGTETALYPCVVGVLFFLIIGLHSTRVSWPLSAALGMTLGLGALGKVTFATIGGPVVVAAIVFAWFGRLGGWRPRHLLGACAIGGVISGPFYVRNLPAVMASAHEAAYNARYSYESWSWANTVDWLSMVAAWGFGRGAILLVIGLASASVIIAVRRLMKGEKLDLLSKTAVSIYLCLAAGLPIMVSQVLMTLTWTTRHISPGYIAVTMAACVAAGSAGVLRSRVAWLAAAALFYVQFSVWTPEALNNRRDIWDWEPFYEAVRQHADPMYIVHLGNGISFNPPFIQAPWVQRGRTVWEQWLWRPEEGPIDWNKIERELARATVVLTAPGYIGNLTDKEDRDNAHNDEFFQRLRADHRFEGPLKFDMGGSQDGATVVAFVSKIWTNGPGWNASSGLAGWEGPYPNLSLPFLVRWGLGPETQLSFKTSDDAPRILRLTCLSHQPQQAMTVLLDGNEVTRQSFEQTGVMKHISIPLRQKAGAHEVTLRYARWAKGARTEAVLFQKIEIVKGVSG